MSMNRLTESIDRCGSPITPVFGIDAHGSPQPSLVLQQSTETDQIGERTKAGRDKHVRRLVIVTPPANVIGLQA